MKKLYYILIILFVFSIKSFSQLENYLGQIDQNDVKNYVKPLVTSLGVSMNSGAYYTADVPAIFGFSVSVKGMMILVPDDQKTFAPTLPEGYSSTEQTATVYGKKDGGKIYMGPKGFYAFPGGFELSNVAFGFPQVTLSLMHTELLVRYVPALKLGNKDISLMGFGVKHNISHYIPLFPVDVAFQVLYNDFKLKDIFTSSHLAFSLHASKSLGPLTAYGGLQYESTNFNFTYTIPGDPQNPNPNLQQKQNVSVDIKGTNGFRFTLGGAFSLALIVLNADVNFGSQTALTAGLTFKF